MDYNEKDMLNAEEVKMKRKQKRKIKKKIDINKSKNTFHIFIIGFVFFFILLFVFSLTLKISNNLLYKRDFPHNITTIFNNPNILENTFNFSRKFSISLNDSENINNIFNFSERFFAEYEKSECDIKINISIVQKRLGQIKYEKKNKKDLNESDISKQPEQNDNFKEISDLISLCFNFSLKENNITNFKKCENPKISVIIPIFNSENFIFNLQYSIQRQALKDLEIIYIDDCSTDNSIQIVENFQKKDKRIILLKNKKNSGEFFSRNKAAIFAKGEYIQFIDSDDVLLGNILENAYITAKINNLDIVQYHFMTTYKRQYKVFREMIKRNIIYQPELSDQMYYGRGRLQQDNFFIFNKIIRTEIFLRSLIYIGDDYLKENIYMNEDLIQLFSVLRVANSLLFINLAGYAKMFYYDKNQQSNFVGDPKTANRIFHDNFLELKFLFNKTKNNGHDKAICLDFLNMNKNLYSSIINNITEGFELFDEVFNLLLNSEYFNVKQKEKIRESRQKIMRNYKANNISLNNM